MQAKITTGLIILASSIGLGGASNTSELHTYNGYAEIISSKVGKKCFNNHAAYISKTGDPQLEELAIKLKGNSKDNEVIAQKYLHYVSTEIKYVFDHPRNSKQILEDKKTDCSGKVILYASLLEQSGIDYKIAYLQNHVMLGVSGDFPNENGMAREFGGKHYTLAETTIPGFILGITPASDKDVKFYQEGGYNKHAICTISGRILPFDSTRSF